MTIVLSFNLLFEFNFCSTVFKYIRLPEALSLYSLCLHVAPLSNQRAILPILTNFAQALLEADDAVGPDSVLQAAVAATAALPQRGFPSYSPLSSEPPTDSSVRPLRDLATTLARSLELMVRAKAQEEGDLGEFIDFLQKMNQIMSSVGVEVQA